MLGRRFCCGTMLLPIHLCVPHLRETQRSGAALVHSELISLRRCQIPLDVNPEKEIKAEEAEEARTAALAKADAPHTLTDDLSKIMKVTAKVRAVVSVAYSGDDVSPPWAQMLEMLAQVQAKQALQATKGALARKMQLDLEQETHLGDMGEATHHLKMVKAPGISDVKMKVYSKTEAAR